MTTSRVTVGFDVRRLREARKARRRLYPVSFLYSGYSMTLLVMGLRSERRVVAVLFFTAGIALWTLVEYLVHRYVLHGRFPDGPGLPRHLLHRYFDHLHWEHHARPWDGNHISGTIRDTAGFAALFAALSFLAPPYTVSMLLAGVMQSYILEEWIHHSVHFHNFKSRYFWYIKRHHLYHHSPRGSDVGYGLTNGFWDVVWGTRIPSSVREALYRRSPAVANARTRAGRSAG